MSKIIFLNGCGSAGKTSIAKAITHLSDQIWLTFGVDTFIDMLPQNKRESYFKFIPNRNDRGPTMRVDLGPKAEKLFGVMPSFAKMLANEGNSLIIDEVLFHGSSLKSYATNLSGHTVYYIGVLCDLDVMQEREILRGNRCIGLSNDQIDRVHQGDLGSYDFKVDTTHLSSFEAARQILEFINNNPTPARFQEIVLKK
jgi:chloramphenicol 3-O phosphotransferase